jgi:hypothetical protein
MTAPSDGDLREKYLANWAVPHMTAPSDGDLREKYLANWAVPHMRQSPVVVPFHGHASESPR